jgi:hypothetical protein
MLRVCHFEGIKSERGIAYKAAKPSSADAMQDTAGGAPPWHPSIHAGWRGISSSSPPPEKVPVKDKEEVQKAYKLVWTEGDLKPAPSSCQRPIPVPQVRLLVKNPKKSGAIFCELRGPIDPGPC